MRDRVTSLNVSLAIGVVRFETLLGGGAASPVMLKSRFNANSRKFFARQSV